MRAWKFTTLIGPLMLLGVAAAQEVPLARKTKQDGAQRTLTQPTVVKSTSLRSGSTNGDGARIGQAQSSDGLLQLAISRMTKLPSISAKIRHQSFLFNQQLVGSGSYLQQHSDDGIRVKLELAIRTEERVTSLRHINTGRALWISENTDDRQSVSKIDLDVVREELGKKLHTHSMMDAILTGGMPSLLTSLRTNFEFRKPQSLTFQKTRVWAIAGQWRPEQLKTLMPQIPDLVASDGSIRLEKMPHYFPTRVFVLLGQDDLFPYRVEYRKTTARREKSKSRLLNKPINDTLVTMDFYRVNLNARIKSSAFKFDSGDVQVVFGTDDFIKKYR